MGFARTRCDHCVFVWRKGTTHIIVPVYVDDPTIVGRTKADKDAVKAELARRFKPRDLGPISLLLAVGITRDRAKRRLSMDQRRYTQDMLDTFGMTDCSPVLTPMDPNTRLSASMSPQTPEEKAEMVGVPYINAVGALLYLAIATRPDIAHAVGVLSRFSKNPGPRHWTAVKHLFRYLKGTLDYKLTFWPDESGEPFTSFVDADHGGNPDDGRSTSGFVLKIGSGAVSWSSKPQTTVALSTTEAEYVAACYAGREVLWLRNLLSELGFEATAAPSRLRIDNQSAISVAKNPEHHGRMKHLDLAFYWLRDTVEAGLITVDYIPRSQMPADALTKALGAAKVAECARMMGLTSPSGGSVEDGDGSV
ncbi:hypothetical protein PUNSTDRAFT_59270 [Punctularia strigosozonata HHB-11173 SS5]|uniref:uncharacterized protein n=1 Tax=Punctularia strigosozonata (strain HHB-11173) TaxID=741275 RepID=UPI0004417247|nr:uncharacterized protein PUNSTDRAFT_59270 [Punctularia strigosozonata HHB-11173 SS5]EIN13264.1 hypothetical protein PUNSTDRAFT_59270 [Punctularia strigosozonata HHB-11173 SS5]